MRLPLGFARSAGLVLLAGAASAAEDDGASRGRDKGGYSLFNPTPDALLRPYNPDRPGLSHDPTTVDAGHVEIETGAFEHVYDPRGAGTTSTRRYFYGNPTLRVGLTDTTEFQLAAPIRQLSRESGQDGVRGRGFGDTLIATKTNLLGNDGGDHLLALLPTLKLPTAPHTIGNGRVEGTVAVPYNYNLTKDLVFTVEPSAGVLRNGANTRYRDSYGMIVGLDQTIATKFVASLEVFTQASTARHEPTNWGVSPSLAYFVTKNLQLDGGVNFGLNKATARYNPYLGVSVRF